MKVVRALAIAVWIETILCLFFVGFGNISPVSSQNDKFISDLIGSLHSPGVCVCVLLSRGRSEINGDELR